MNIETTPLVLIAGTGGTENFWDPVIQVLGTRRDVFAVTSVGDDPDAISRDVLETVRARGVDHFHLIGESLGAVIATHLTASCPNAVESLLLLNGWTQTDVRMQVEFDLWDRLLATGPTAFAHYLPLMAFGPTFWRSQTPQSAAELSHEIAAVIADAHLWVLDTGHGSVIEEPTAVACATAAHLDEMAGVR